MRRLTHYVTRARELGVFGTVARFHERLTQKMYAVRIRRKVLRGNAGFSWKKIARRHGVSPTFSRFCDQVAQTDFVTPLLDSPALTATLPEHYTTAPALTKTANKTCDGWYDLLGSGPAHFAPGAIPWHRDFR